MPFLHVTTRITDWPHDKLLQEKGFRGFPSLAFMDAEGEVLAEPQDRSVASFRACLDALEQVDEVTARVEAGDASAKVDLLLIEHALGRVTGSDFAARAAELAEVATPEQQAKLNAIATDEEAWELVLEAYQGDREAAVEGMLAMVNARRLPSPGSRPETYFWSVLAEHGQAQGDTALLRRIARALEATETSNEELTSLIASMRETAGALVERDELAERAAGGEAGLEAKILVIELRLDAVTFEAFEDRLEAALAVATEEEAAELRQGRVNLETASIVDAFWGGGDWDELGGRLIGLFTADGLRPSGETIELSTMVILNWAWSDKDADSCEALADRLAEAWSEDEAMARTIDQLRKMAEEKRGEG